LHLQFKVSFAIGQSGYLFSIFKAFSGHSSHGAVGIIFSSCLVSQEVLSGMF